MTDEAGIHPPKGLEIDPVKQRRLLKWLTNLYLVFPKTQTFSATINPTLVSANSESTQTFTVAGLTTKDIITVNKPSRTAGLDIVQAWVSAADTVSITFQNTTGSGIDSGSETYLIMSTRL